MIYIISGASRSGKSIVAKGFFEKNFIPYIPLDCLMMGFMNGVSSLGIHDKLWPDEIAEKMWPFLKAVCKNMIDNEIDYIFEGEAVLPEHIKELSDLHPGQIKTCFLGYTEVDVKKKISEVKRYPNHLNDWLLSQEEEEILNHIENMITYSHRIKKECIKYNLDYFDTSKDFEKQIDKVIMFLDGK